LPDEIGKFAHVPILPQSGGAREGDGYPGLRLLHGVLVSGTKAGKIKINK
jgi:hypothetical protein